MISPGLPRPWAALRPAPPLDPAGEELGHLCNAWCGGAVHCDLFYTTAADPEREIVALRRRWVSVVRVEETEAPPADKLPSPLYVNGIAHRADLATLRRLAPGLRAYRYWFTVPAGVRLVGPSGTPLRPQEAEDGPYTGE